MNTIIASIGSIASNIKTIDLFTLNRVSNNSVSKYLESTRIEKVVNKNNETIALVHYSERFFLKSDSRYVDLNIYPINYELNLNRFNSIINAYGLSTKGNRKIYLIKPLTDAYYRWYNGSIHRFDNLKSFSISYKLISDKLEINEGYISEKFRMEHKKLDSVLSLLLDYFRFARIHFRDHDIDYDSIIKGIQETINNEELEFAQILEEDESLAKYIIGILKLLRA